MAVQVQLPVSKRLAYRNAISDDLQYLPGALCPARRYKSDSRAKPDAVPNVDRQQMKRRNDTERTS